MNFNPNWICRGRVTVDEITPAVGDGTPLAFVNAVRNEGAAKFG